MLLLHPHYILLHPLYTCPALFCLMLLHIFLIFLVKTGCTGWYSFLPTILSVIFHTVLVYIPTWYKVYYTAVRETSGLSCALYLFLYGYFGYLLWLHSLSFLFYSILQAIWSPYEGNPLLRPAFFGKSSWYVSMIGDILCRFPPAVHQKTTLIYYIVYHIIGKISATFKAKAMRFLPSQEILLLDIESWTPSNRT